MKRIAAVVLLSSVAASAFAADEGVYAGVTLGNGKPNISPVAGATLSKSSDFIYGGLVGYQYNKNLATEVQFTGVGKAVDVAGNSIKGDALSVSAVGILPVSEGFEVYGKLGVASATTKASAGATNLGASRTGVTFGVGAQYNVNANLGLRLGYDNYSIATANAAGVKSNANAKVITIGAVYKF